ncbi:MAG: PaaI family thioesterase [Pseudomonadales bacterium]|nr:PaaI family thioesterase [Pseudomonadales bacterium]
MAKYFDFLLDDKNTADIVSSIPFAKYLDIKIQQNINGEIIFRLPFAEKNIGNPIIRALHGGIMASFMECSATLMIIGTVAHDYLPKCVNQTTEYLSRSKDVDSFAKVKMNRVGRRVIHSTTTCWQEEGKPVVISHARFLVGSAAEA